jgi:hypothetical protein
VHGTAASDQKDVFNALIRNELDHKIRELGHELREVGFQF